MDQENESLSYIENDSSAYKEKMEKLLESCSNLESGSKIKKQQENHIDCNTQSPSKDFISTLDLLK